MSRSFLGSPLSVTEARRFVTTFLIGWPVVEAAELIVSELATNAIRHSATNRFGGRFHVMIHAQHDRVWLGVTDEGGSRSPRMLSPDEQEESGRGLLLVGALALRPAEAADLTADEIDLPDVENGDEWGWFCLGDSAPAVGADWTGNGKRRESRELKHRARTAVRPVPIPPPLVAILRSHLTDHGVSPDGHLFVGERGGPLSESVYGRVWQKARTGALSKAEAASPLAARPYDYGMPVSRRGSTRGCQRPKLPSGQGTA